MRCTTCGGSGYVMRDVWVRGRQMPPEHGPCECAERAERARRLDAVWPGLGRADPVDQTNLKKWVRQDCTITATVQDLRTHVARLLLDDERVWAEFDAITDADLITARYAAKGEGEAQLAALTTHADLLLIELGVRRQANKTLPDLVLTAIDLRQRAGQATWVLLDPRRPLKEGLACWSAELAEVVRALPQVKPAAPEALKATPAEALAAAVGAAKGRLPRAEALALLGGPSKATLSRIARDAGLRSVEDPPGSKLWVLVPQGSADSPH